MLHVLINEKYLKRYILIKFEYFQDSNILEKDFIRRQFLTLQKVAEEFYWNATTSIIKVIFTYFSV